MSKPEKARWRAYVEERGLTPIEVLGEIIRSWDNTAHVPSVPRRPNRPSEVDLWQDGLRDQIVAACDQLLERQQVKA